MYLDYYQLREYPFTLASDPRFLYYSGAHQEAMAALLYALRERKGVALLVGEPGTGKTTLLHAVLEMLPGGVQTQTLDTPLHQTPESLLEALLAGFGLVPEASLSARLRQMEGFVRERQAAGECVLLVVDEAQDLNPVALEQIRLLSNLEHGRQKLLQIVLSGQPELREHLRTAAGRALEQRVAVRCALPALGVDEVAAYLAARLERAGGQAALFEPAARRLLHRYSGGVPRLINVLADHALLAGFEAQSRRISEAMVERAAAQLDLVPAAPAAAAPAPAMQRSSVPPVSAVRPLAPSAPAAIDPPLVASGPRPGVLDRFVQGWTRRHRPEDSPRRERRRAGAVRGSL